MSEGTEERVPVRACFAFAGAGSLGTFLAGAAREVLLAIRSHNAALALGEGEGRSFLHPRWGRITVDALGGASAGALCSAQVVRALFDPDYLGEGRALDASGTFTGDWIRGAELTRLAVVGNTPAQAGPIEAPGWTLLSGARLFQLAAGALTPSPESRPDEASPLDASGVVAIGVTLTDLLGYHAPAEFAPDRIVGHPSFGLPAVEPSQVTATEGRPVRDLGGRGHAEVRKLFVGANPDAVASVRRFLNATKRRGRARAVQWGPEASERLAALVSASAALPLAVGPLAMSDRAADAQVAIRRLYMDGGILNNKPVAPALKLARWQDGARLFQHVAPGDAIAPGLVEDELVYERVCFFFDAFPDRTRDDWRSVHPDQALKQTGVFRLTGEAGVKRDARIDEALSVPTAAGDVFAESMLTALRAQDLLGIAKTNEQLVRRDAYIDQRCRASRDTPSRFKLDTVEKAQALAAVLARERGPKLSENLARKVAERVWESDGYSGLGGRRPVTMVPVFAPENLKSVFAGEALYAVGGLLDVGAREHDARVGQDVGREVVAGIRSEGAREEVRLPAAPAASLPSDSTALVERLRVSTEALINGVGRRPGPVRLLAKLPLHVPALLRMAKRRLDRAIRGEHEE